MHRKLKIENAFIFLLLWAVSRPSKPPSIPQATQTTNQFGGNQFEIQTKTELGFGFTISYKIVFLTI